MNRWLSVFAIGALLALGAPAEGRSCRHQADEPSCARHVRLAQMHHGRRLWHPHEPPVILAAPPPFDPTYIPYEQFYPPMPASIFDLPPDRDFLNDLR